MPSRTVTLGIIVLWLATVTWMIFRDFVPVWTATEPPTFLIDLDDEVAAKEIFWTIYSEGKRVGTAKTEVKFLDKGQYQLHGELMLHDLNLFDNLNPLGLELKRITSSYLVNREGRIQTLNSKIFLPSPQFPELALEVQGVVEDQTFHPKTTIFGLPPEGADLIKRFLPNLEKPVAVSEQGSIINITHPFNKIRHLSEGKTWHIPVLNPVPSLDTDQGIAVLYAKVVSKKLNWNGQDLDCWRVDFAKHPNDHEKDAKIYKPDLRIWVRQDNAVVLQHEARYSHLEVIMKRAQ